MSQQPAAPAAAAPAKSRKTLFIAVAALVVLGGGGGAYWKFFASPADPTVAEAQSKEPPAIINFDPFVVNLSDSGNPRFLRVTLGLVVEGEEHAKEFSENAVVRTKVRSSLIELLSQQQATHDATM